MIYSEYKNHDISYSMKILRLYFTWYNRGSLNYINTLLTNQDPGHFCCCCLLSIYRYTALFFQPWKRTFLCWTSVNNKLVQLCFCVKNKTKTKTQLNGGLYGVITLLATRCLCASQLSPTTITLITHFLSICVLWSCSFFSVQETHFTNS